MVWIKFRSEFGEVLYEIPDEKWKAYLSNSYIKGSDKPLDKSKLKKALGYTWYLDDEKRKVKPRKKKKLV